MTAPAIAALAEGRAAVAALRRSLPRRGPGVVSCRTPEALRQLLTRRIIEAVVFAPRPGLPATWSALRRDFPAIPLVALSGFRPDDGEALTTCRQEGVAAVLVEGGRRRSRRAGAAGFARRPAPAGAGRCAEAPPARRPAPAGGVVRLVEQAGRPVSTTQLAESLGVSREHLSRQFGAGGAPNLKRVIDFLRVVVATQLLRNPGYSVATVAGLLGFASASHLGLTARRIAGSGPGELPTMTPAELLGRFVRGHTRSRL